MKKTFLIVKATMFSFALFLSLGFENKYSLLTSTISGPASVAPGATEYYEASFTVTPDPLSIIAWGVDGGTITSQNVNPNNGVIYCYIQWSSTPGSGSVSIYEDLGSQNSDKTVSICGEADGGPNVIICPGGSSVIGIPGLPNTTYSWTPTTGLNNPNIPQPTASPTTTTIYTVTMTQGSCPVAQTSVTVTVASPTSTVSPAGPIAIYYSYESPQNITLTCSPASSYQWYKNNSPISGATSQTFVLDATHYNFTVSGTQNYKCVTQCATSNTVTFDHTPCYSTNDYPVTMQYTACQSTVTSSNYLQLYAPYLGAGTISTWWAENNPGTNQILINSSGHLTFTGNNNYYDAIITKSSLSNGTQTYMYYPFTIFTGCKSANNNGLPNVNSPINTNLLNPKLEIYPNPANKEILINSRNYIKEVEVYDFQGILIKKIHTARIKSLKVEIAGLIPGVYFCRIFTETSNETLKFIIQR